MPFIENLKEILLCSLQYPAYARPEYFLKNQVESGWSKNVFLQALHELCKGYRQHNYTMWRLSHPKDQNIEKEEIGLTLADESNGLIAEFETSFGKSYKLITDTVTLFLMDAIEEASHLNEPEVNYSDLQIVSFFETAIRFIRNEIKVQAGIEQDPFLINRTYTQKSNGKSHKDETEYVLHDYYIACPKPFFNYYTFKEAIRNLLLNSQHGEKLKVMLQHTVEDVKLIIKTWNEVIQPIASGGGNLIKSDRYITFTDDNASYTATFGQSIEIASRGKTHYTNYNLVKFASDAGDIVANDVLGIKEESPKPIKANPQSLFEVFSSEYDYQKAIEALQIIKVIDQKNQNLVGSALKGIMQVWIEILRNERKCLKLVSDDLLTKLLNKEFQGLQLSEKAQGRHFRNSINKSAKAKYRPKLLALIRE